MAYYQDETVRLFAVVLLQIDGTDDTILIMQYQYDPVITLIGYSVGGRVYVYDEESKCYLEWDNENRSFRQKSS